MTIEITIRVRLSTWRFAIWRILWSNRTHSVVEDGRLWRDILPKNILRFLVVDTNLLGGTNQKAGEKNPDEGKKDHLRVLEGLLAGHQTINQSSPARTMTSMGI
ncbi:hypothetical protein O181_014529 [Austropuccinia psidii MF-1]|uniref:Uncharacterized protein n=1 Tax=Austropuccinia psidii MF-1 TaxID=1389203 RepID=A0A9Q3C094_9BASI|nr:hypothetical protein [Austropuccinia psidii MF-1]